MNNKAQLIGQILCMFFGQYLVQHGIDSSHLEMAVGGLIAFLGVVWKFLHFNRATASTGAGASVAPGAAGRVLPLVVLAGLAAALAGMITACAPLAPGADPLVVNVERTETMAKSSFDLVLNVDNSQRAFFATNAPAFHSFCQWLRAPQTVEGTNTLPRAAAMLVSLDDVKLDYEASRASSNAVFTALETVTSAVNQANSWLSVVTNKPALH